MFNEEYQKAGEEALREKGCEPSVFNVSSLFDTYYAVSQCIHIAGKTLPNVSVEGDVSCCPEGFKQFIQNYMFSDAKPYTQN